MRTETAYCECERPVMDVEHDAGCRRCGLPVDFSPLQPPSPPRFVTALADDRAGLRKVWARLSPVVSGAFAPAEGRAN